VARRYHTNVAVVVLCRRCTNRPVRFEFNDAKPCCDFTLPVGEVAKYCDEYVCVSVCLSARISPEPHARSLPIFVHVAYGRGSVLFWRGALPEVNLALMGLRLRKYVELQDFGDGYLRLPCFKLELQFYTADVY